MPVAFHLFVAEPSLHALSENVHYLGVWDPQRKPLPQQQIHLWLGEAKIFVKPSVGDGVRNKIIGASENAFFGDSQAAGDDREF